MLHKIMYKILNAHKSYKDKRGMVVYYLNLYKEIYNNCALYNVIPINEEELTYKVYVGEGDASVHYKTQNVNTRDKPVLAVNGRTQNYSANMLCSIIELLNRNH